MAYLIVEREVKMLILNGYARTIETKNSITYKRQAQRHKKLIKKLFWELAIEVIRENITKDEIKIREILRRIKLIVNNSQASYVRYMKDYNIIKIGIGGIHVFSKYGLSGYYIERRELLDKYIRYNRHNTIRVIIYHELKHLCDYLNDSKGYFSESKKSTEYRADSYAIKHLKHSNNASWNE